ncbi:uncharacterized protein LACBIDRAFT_328729 [Laccaria bicolor S238N-H82]|uniref:Predicted protein n=1 Tax=Laccaria bicolor (strain S238N-H82 / ATCC MYA-4686) TaxID=486041 RepID=B0DFT8_LACBS|nr:uncharacterized protein LACBIDRAFT_328729 [Laccaria bicolor S238N-H82]EDR06520.1 predicted protein [Laccaria bicolor S238N-H82]|eukprot:XP_001882892.1 predicted protein [Laccaria bicolor S238N-H82]
MPTAFLGCRAAVQAFEVGIDLFSRSRLNAMSEAEIMATLYRLHSYMLALFSDILARPGGPTSHKSRLLASVYNAAQHVEEHNRSTAWEEWLQEPLDGRALYSPGECLDSSFTTGYIGEEDAPSDRRSSSPPGIITPRGRAHVVHSPSPTGSDSLFLPSPGPESLPVSSPDSTPPVPVRRSKRTRAMVMDEDSDVVEIIDPPSTTPLKLAIGPPGKRRKIIEKPSSDDEAIQHPNRSRSSSSDSMPEPCLQCSARKDSAVKNCTFRGWGTPCGPCDVVHVSSCEYYLNDECRGAVRDVIRNRLAIHAPSAISALMESIKEDALHMRTLSVVLEAIRNRRDANLREFANAIADLCLTAEPGTLLGTVFETREEFGLWYSFVQDFVDTQGVPVPAGSTTADLERLVSLFQRDDSPPIAGPSSLTPRQCRVCSLSLIPSIAVASPGLPPSAHSQEEEEEVIDELVDEEILTFSFLNFEICS